jgi:hypothetical protein
MASQVRRIPVQMGTRELNRVAVTKLAATLHTATPSVARGSLKHWIRLFPQMTNSVSQGAFA